MFTIISMFTTISMTFLHSGLEGLVGWWQSKRFSMLSETEQMLKELSEKLSFLKNLGETVTYIQQ